ncbi:MAG: nucleotidyltransferase domain-containing protein [Desulfosarcina sp.]|nr:nucleotidyltransferase domain-containing protein [Desulfobacterales bacterium]
MTDLQDKLEALPRITRDLKVYHPRAIVLFGSLARHLQALPLDHAPKDIDILVVGDNVPPAAEKKNYEAPLELLRFRLHPFIELARSLRYDPKPMALTRLYGNQLARRHARNVIAACLLLGPAYSRFGIEQIEVGSLADPRDYSVHRVLHGDRWWRHISDFACERRGPIKRFSDKIAGRDQFVGC